MNFAIAIFVAAFVLMLVHDWLSRRPGFQGLLNTPGRVRVDKAAEAFWPACLGGAVLAMTAIQVHDGAFNGLRMGLVQRGEHPVWFWLIAAVMFLVSTAMLILNLADVARALKLPGGPPER